MGMADNLKNLISRQKTVLSELEAECQALENSDLVKENALLKADIDKLRVDFERANKSAADFREENISLKNALYEQIYNEKVKLINTTAQKLDIYFRSSVYGELNKLSALENNVKERIGRIKRDLEHNNAETNDDVNKRLDELSALLDSRATAARAHIAQPPGAFTQQECEELEALKSEQITDEQVKAALKSNNLERFVGLNVLNTVGVFLIIIGAITLARFTYFQLPDLLKGIMLFVLGGLMLAAGEILNRRKPNIFSLGISAGGIGVLYGALAASYFALSILDIYPAIIICVLITSGAFVLSNRYDSQTIAAFALIGGYLPIFSIRSDLSVIYGIMVYFIVLNLFALLISFAKKWSVSSFIGLFLNIIGTFYICSNFYITINISGTILTILYVLFAFLIYTSIPVVSTYRTGARFRKSDISLLAINTFFSSLIMYSVFYNSNLEDYDGLLAVIFAAIYLLLGRFIEKRFSGDERHTRALFYLTGLAFVVLFIPLQFGREWLSLGWLIEGVLLAAYGILTNEKKFRQCGFIICLLCLGVFIFVDCFWISDYLFAYNYLWMTEAQYLFIYKYLAVTLGSLVILGAYMYKRMTSGKFVIVYKYFALANMWLYFMYLIRIWVRGVLYVHSVQTVYQIDYLLSAAAVVVTFVLAYTFSRIKLLSDPGIRVLSAVLYVIGIFWLFVINTTMNPVSHAYWVAGTPAFGIMVAGTAILFVLGILSIFALRDLVVMFMAQQKFGVEWYPLIISGYFVIILTQNLITQYNLAFSSAAISILYVLTALAWIIFGFKRRYTFIRKSGLGLALLAVVKLFIIDLAGLTQGYQIISYFALGITLIAISFVYQYFNKRLELKEGTSDETEKGD